MSRAWPLPKPNAVARLAHFPDRTGPMAQGDVIAVGPVWKGPS